MVEELTDADGIAVRDDSRKPLLDRVVECEPFLARELEDDGVAKFGASYTGVLGTIETKAGALAVDQGR